MTITAYELHKVFMQATTVGNYAPLYWLPTVTQDAWQAVADVANAKIKEIQNGNARTSEGV